MASIEAAVETPVPPTTLKVSFPGRARPAQLPLSSFSREELEKVGAAYTQALIKRGEEQRAKPAEPTPRTRTPREAKAEP